MALLSDAGALYIGDQPATVAYLGSAEVWTPPSTEPDGTLLELLQTDSQQRLWEADTAGFTDRSANAAGTIAGTSVSYGQPSLLPSGVGSSASFAAGGSVATGFVHDHTTASTFLALFRADPGAAAATNSKVYARSLNVALGWGHTNTTFRYAAEASVSGTSMGVKWHAGTPATDTTYLVMVTFDGANVRTYLASTNSDAALVTTRAAAGSLNAYTGGGIIGNNGTPGTQPFPGRIQYVAIRDAVTGFARFQEYAAAAFTA